METRSDLIFLKYFQDTIESFSKLDERVEKNPIERSTVDMKISDYMHIIENNDLSESASNKIVKEIRKERQIRRGLANEQILISKYQELKARISSKENRQFIVAEIQKKMKSLDTEYKNRVLTDEEVKELLKEDIIQHSGKRVRKTSEKNQQINAKIKEMLDKGCSQKEMAIELGISQGAVCQRIKKIRELENA